MSEETDSSRSKDNRSGNLETTIKPSLTEDDYLDKVRELVIEWPEYRSRSWKDGMKWPYNEIPSQILEQSPTNVSADVLAENDIMGKSEAEVLFQDLETVVKQIWGSWDDMFVTMEARNPKRERFSAALLSHLWPLWKEAAGFPENDSLKKWLEKYITTRKASKRNMWTVRMEKDKKNTAPTSADNPSVSRPSSSISSGTGLERLYTLCSMHIVFGRSSDRDGTQDSPQDEASGTIELTKLAMATNDVSSTAGTILELLKSKPASWDPMEESLLLLDSHGGVHYIMNGERGKDNLVKALLAEQKHGKSSLEVKFVPHTFNFDLDPEDDGLDVADDEDAHTRPIATSIRHLHDLWTNPEKEGQGCVVLLNGFSGSGSLRIAEAIKKNLPENNTRIVSEDAKAFAAEAIIPVHGDAHMELRKNIRRVMFDALTEEMVKQENLKAIMVECLSDDERGIQVLAEHVRIARGAKVPFHLINLSCELEEHVNRVEDYPRAEDSEERPEDASLLRGPAGSDRLADLTRLPRELLSEVDADAFELNTTGMTAEQILSKELIRVHVEQSE